MRPIQGDKPKYHRPHPYFRRDRVWVWRLETRLDMCGHLRSILASSLQHPYRLGWANAKIGHFLKFGKL